MALIEPFLSFTWVLLLCPLEVEHTKGLSCPDICSSWVQGPWTSASCLTPGSTNPRGYSHCQERPPALQAPCLLESSTQFSEGLRTALRRLINSFRASASVSWLLAVESSTTQGLGTLSLEWRNLGLNLCHLNHKLYNLDQVTFFWALVFPSVMWE